MKTAKPRRSASAKTVVRTTAKTRAKTATARNANVRRSKNKTAALTRNLEIAVAAPTPEQLKFAASNPLVKPTGTRQPEVSPANDTRAKDPEPVRPPRSAKSMVEGSGPASDRALAAPQKPNPPEVPVGAVTAKLGGCQPAAAVAARQNSSAEGAGKYLVSFVAVAMLVTLVAWGRSLNQGSDRTEIAAVEATISLPDRIRFPWQIARNHRTSQELAERAAVPPVAARAADRAPVLQDAESEVSPAKPAEYRQGLPTHAQAPFANRPAATVAHSFSAPRPPAGNSAKPAAASLPDSPPQETATSEDPLQLAADTPASVDTAGDSDLQELETLLHHLSLDPGDPDGVIDEQSVNAIRLYQEMAGLPIDGQASQHLLTDLREVVRLYDTGQ